MNYQNQKSIWVTTSLIWTVKALLTVWCNVVFKKGVHDMNVGPPSIVYLKCV